MFRSMMIRCTAVACALICAAGAGPLMTGILSGEVQSSISSVVPAIPHVKAVRPRNS